MSVIELCFFQVVLRQSRLTALHSPYVASWNRGSQRVSRSDESVCESEVFLRLNGPEAFEIIVDQHPINDRQQAIDG